MKCIACLFENYLCVFDADGLVTIPCEKYQRKYPGAMLIMLSESSFLNQIKMVLVCMCVFWLAPVSSSRASQCLRPATGITGAYFAGAALLTVFKSTPDMSYRHYIVFYRQYGVSYQLVMLRKYVSLLCTVRVGDMAKITIWIHLFQGYDISQYNFFFFK